MRPAASRPPHTLLQPPSLAHLPSASGQRPRIRAVAPVIGEEFREPDLDLVSAASWGALDAADPTELRAARALLRERERTIHGLSARVESLESTMAALLETLRAREAELSQLQELLLPAPVMPAVERSQGSLQAARAQPSANEASLPSPKPALEARACAPQPIRASLTIGDLTVSEADAKRGLGEPLDCLQFCEHLQLFAGIALDEVLGVFVPTYRTVPLGSIVELELEFANGETVRAPGVVAWTRAGADSNVERPGLGVTFTDAKGTARAAFERLCRARPPLYIEL